MQLAFTNLDEKSFIIIDSFDFDFLLTLQCCCHPRFIVLAVAFETLQNCKVRPIVMAKPNTKKLHVFALGGAALLLDISLNISIISISAVH